MTSSRHVLNIIKSNISDRTIMAVHAAMMMPQPTMPVAPAVDPVQAAAATQQALINQQAFLMVRQTFVTRKVHSAAISFNPSSSWMCRTHRPSR